MNTRSLVIAAAIFFASPFLASAVTTDCSTVTVGSPCQNSSGVMGTCTDVNSGGGVFGSAVCTIPAGSTPVSDVLRTTQATDCSTLNVGSQCWTSSGVQGMCAPNATNGLTLECVVYVPSVQPTSPTTPVSTPPPTTPVYTPPTTPVNTGGTNVTLINPLGAGTSLTTLLNSVLKFVVQIGAVIVILMLVYVGFKFVVAQGNPAKIEEARRMLLWTIVGALILLGAQVIAIGICETTNALSTGGSVISCAF